jgi:hypothetical protein
MKSMEKFSYSKRSLVGIEENCVKKQIHYCREFGTFSTIHYF